jgi:hypothetical protein
LDDRPDDETERCAHCDDPINGDPVHGQGSVTENGARRLAGGKSVAASDLFGFDDGPYCSLKCAIAGEADQGGDST